MLQAVHDKASGNLELQDKLLLLLVGYCLAAQNAYALQGPSAGDQSSPWAPDQERIVKVHCKVMRRVKFCAQCLCCLI